MALLALLVRWSLRNRVVVLGLTALFVVLGVRAASTLSVDAVPDVTNVQVQIITSAPALSPLEIEQYVSVPVERAMAGIPRTTDIRSLSKYGLSVVTIVFDDATNLYFARQLVSERMREAEQAVPPQYGEPRLGPITSGLGEIFQFVVRSDHLTLMQLEELLDWQIGPALRTVPGIVEVNAFGGEDRQYQVMIHPARLQAAGLSLSQVADALKKSNANAGGGYLEHNREHFVIRTDGLVKNLDDLRGVVVGATPQGVPITLATVAEVQFGPRIRRGAGTKDGQGEVAMGVALMLLGENARTVTAAVKTKLAAVERTLPKGTTIEPFYDRSELVDRTIHTVGKNLVEGAALVIVVLLLLLGDLRAGLVVALVIPLSLLFAVTVMRLAGLSGNLMSLGAVDFGLLVDGAVIIVENAVRRLSEAQAAKGLNGVLSPEERLQTVEAATLEVRSASVFGELIIAIVYLPVLALTGIEGKLFRPMATTVLLALGGAFLLSVTVVPVLTSLLVRPQPDGHEPWLLRLATRAFVPTFRLAQRFRPVTVGLGVLSLGGAIAAASTLGAEFVPQLDEGDILLEVRKLPDVSLTEAVALDLRIERALRSIPEIEHVVARAGAPEVATDPMSISSSDVYIGLQPRAKWRRGLTKEGLAKQIQDRVEEAVPEVGIGLSQPIQMRTNELVAGIRSDVALLLYGPNLDELLRLGNDAAALLRKVPGATDVRVQQVAGLRYLRITPDRTKLARYGLTIDDVNQAAETLAVGHAVGEVLEGERRFGIVVKVAHGFAGELEPLLALPLRSVSGQLVPLGDVATLAFANGPSEIGREAQSRRISVEFNVRDRDLLSVAEEAQALVAGSLALPVGYRPEWGGQFQHYTEAKARLAVVVPLALGLIAFLLWSAFRDLRAAALIFLGVPFAVIGGILALAARSIPFSISAGVGFVALFGVAVLNGLVLVSFARDLEAQGRSHDEAIREATELRLRPVLVTALVASLGFVPMALSTEPGSEVQRPLATVVIGGLFSATLLTLFVLPVLAAWFGPRVEAPGVPPTE
jgi:heavy metal efflux system protein